MVTSGRGALQASVASTVTVMRLDLRDRKKDFLSAGWTQTGRLEFKTKLKIQAFRNVEGDSFTQPFITLHASFSII